MKYALVVITTVLISLIAAAQQAEKTKDVVVVGDPLTLAREQVIPNWEPTVKIINQSITSKCAPFAYEALDQLEIFYNHLEGVRSKLPKDDPIVKDQPYREKQLEELRKAVRSMPLSNKGCPKEPLPKPKPVS